MNTTFHFKKGNKNQYTMVFSCPGRIEEDKGSPVSGLTGNNLDILITYLNSKNFVFEKADITITNSWKESLYAKKSGKSEASIKDIQSADNLVRLKNEIIHTEDVIFAFGKKAESAIKKLEPYLNVKNIIYLRHLSPRSINRIAIDASIKEKRTEARIKIIGDAIISELNKDKS